MSVRTALLSLVTLVAASACASRAAAACPTEIDRAQLALGYDAFDAAGWRDLITQHCADAAVAQLTAYRDANSATMTPDQRREINFHMGQTLAFDRRDAESIPHFEQARGVDASAEWSAYVEATLAFLRHDAATLAAQRARYAAAEGASPMRLAVIDGFITCADRPYADAVHCAMQGMH